jgi:hypothetical protein
MAEFDRNIKTPYLRDNTAGGAARLRSLKGTTQKPELGNSSVGKGGYGKSKQLSIFQSL